MMRQRFSFFGAGIACIFLTACMHSGFSQTLDPEALSIYEPEPVIITPGVGTAPPSDAVILFDGKDLNEWINSDGSEAAWTVEDGYMTVKPKTGTIKTKQTFGDMQLHVEWRSPATVKGEGQGRGNSGVYIMERYEVQVLDSYNNKTYVNGQAASLYKQHIPLVNACKPPGEWQTYDIIFMAPEFTEKGTLKSPARVTVFHNGVLVQNNVALSGASSHNTIPKYEPHGKASLMLQDHGDLVSFRNIWLRAL